MLTDGTLDLAENKIGYAFRERSLLRQALTHSSFANEQKINKFKDYERLEFLGDAVLELVSSAFLFHADPSMPEGQLTRLRASLVCEQALAYCARELMLGQFLLLGKGEETTGGRTRDSILSDVVEAIIGAIYLDGGLPEAERFIHRVVLSDLEEKQLFYDSKTILQERVQGQGIGKIRYVLAGEEGPAHDKQFVSEVYIGERLAGTGAGHNKKAAEQQAAYQALLSLKNKEK